MKILSSETALRIWHAHREIATAKKLREETLQLMKQHSPNPTEPWQHQLQLGLPTSESSTRLFRVNPQLGIAVIDAHIANMEKELIEASIAARVELQVGTDTGAPAGAPHTKETT